MKGRIKEITVFTVGDSNDITHWSNVPFFFTDALVKKGIKINRINLKENGFLTFIFDKIFGRFLKIIFRGHILNFNKTRLNIKSIEKQVITAVKKFNESDVYIFLNFDYSININKPVVLFHDWTFEYEIREHQRRSPYFIENNYIRYQENAILNADLVISLFPHCALDMTKKYNRDVKYLGNVVNNFYSGTFGNFLIEEKENSNKLLFIGNYKYKEGALLLIKAFRELLIDFPLITLHIIGMDNDILGIDPFEEKIITYGYLDKSKPDHNNKYYSLLKDARIFINPSQLWGGFSSTIEAMYFYTPVIVSPYSGFVSEFGRDIDFGFYNEQFNVNELKLNIIRVLTAKNYRTLAENSHLAAKNCTWDIYMDKVLMSIDSLKINN